MCGRGQSTFKFDDGVEKLLIPNQGMHARVATGDIRICTTRIRVCHVSFSDDGLVLSHDVKKWGFFLRIHVLNMDIQVVALFCLLRDEQVTTRFIDKLQDRILRVGLAKIREVQARVQPLQHAAGKDTDLDVWGLNLLSWAVAFDNV